MSLVFVMGTICRKKETIGTSRRVGHRIVMYSILTCCTLFLGDYEHVLIPSIWNWMAFRYSWILWLVQANACFSEAQMILLSENDLRGRWCWLYHCSASGPSFYQGNIKTGNICTWDVMYEHILSLPFHSPAVFLMTRTDCRQWDGCSCFPLQPPAH